MSPESDVEKPNKQRTIQSVEVGFRLIVRLMERKSAMTLKDLSASADMSPSKAHLYLNSFRNIGLVEQDKRGHYKLGAFALRLGVAAIARLDVIEEAREEMRALRDETGESVFLSVWSGQGACILAKEEGHRDTPLVLQIGYLLPLLRSASGRIFLGYLPRPVIESQLAADLRELQASGVADADPDEIAAEVRHHALGRTESQLNLGFAALSAPIFGHDGSIAAALTILAPTGTLDTSYTGSHARLLSAAAKRVSANLGYGPAEQDAG